MLFRRLLILGLLSGLFAETAAQKIRMPVREQVLNIICQELFRNNMDLPVKHLISGKAFIIVDPIVGEESVRIEDSTSAAMKSFMQFSVNRQMDILKAYDWPVFPLPDSLYIWDKSGSIAKQKDIFQSSSDGRYVICITSKSIAIQQNMLILDTLFQNDWGIFVRFYATSLNDEEYIMFRIDKSSLFSNRVKIWGMLRNKADDKNIY